MHLRQLVPARHQARKGACAAPRKPNRTCTRTTTSRRPGQGEGGARQPRNGARAGPPGGKRRRQGHQGLAEQLVRAQRQSGADGRRHQEPAAELRRRRRGHGPPNVTFGFTSHGQSVFQRVTKEIAHRGQEAQLPGVGKEAAQQHFAVVLDGQLITAPSIDYTKYPEGIDATTGSQISGGFTITSAQNLANELQSGALPIKLELISHSQVSATLGKHGAQPGPDRRPRGLRGRVPVPAALLPRARRDRRRRAWSSTGSTSSR